MPVEAEKNNQKISLYAISIELHFKVGFPTGRDSATFRDKGTEAPSLSRDKGTTGQANNLAKGRDRPGQPKFGTGRDSQKQGRDTGQNGTEQKKDVLKQKRMF